ncbi:hypothetical protein F7725_011793, partial [Dissostichus mawsoni]
MKQRKNKGSGAIKGRSFALLLGFYGHDALKDIHYFIISNIFSNLSGPCLAFGENSQSGLVFPIRGH